MVKFYVHIRPIFSCLVTYSNRIVQYLSTFLDRLHEMSTAAWHNRAEQVGPFQKVNEHHLLLTYVYVASYIATTEISHAK